MAHHHSIFSYTYHFCHLLSEYGRLASRSLFAPAAMMSGPAAMMPGQYFPAPPPGAPVFRPPGDAEADGEDQEPATIDVEDADDQRTDSPACAAGGSLDSGDDTSLSPINVEIEVHCLICSTLINLQLDQYCDIYLDNIVTAHSKLPVSEKLGRVLRYHFSPELLYSHTLCRRCFNIINGIDQLEGRLDKLRYGQDSDTDWAVADAGALF
ncbi:hypothetical protein FJT64_021711 [Amphibalanus amphitrite]|uniref:ZAD domain-containing protein n=1 Tax=Amphibalanus amphitrite TaxID=1232801 RepID=A0A6A4WH93_AMPAM|nr:hypothetical protein FJT64_021711 [Amphibalanus amphitrite]